MYVFVCSTREQSLVLSSSLESMEKREEVLQDKLGSLENQHLQDAGRLKSQLDQAQARTHTLQREVRKAVKTILRVLIDLTSSRNVILVHAV